MGGRPRVWWGWCVVWTSLVGVGVLLAETIHFTNSPKLIMASKNFTTYELEVPGSKPITIIEATESFGGPNDRLDTFSADPQPHQQRVWPASTTSIRTSTGISVSRPAEGGPSAEPAGGSRKTLYSPELLNKFLKEYSEKLRNADSVTRKRLNEITLINSVNREQDERPGGTQPAYQYRNRLQEQQRPQNESSGEAGTPEDGAKTEDEFIFDDTHERHVLGAEGSNKRWYQEGSPGAYQQHSSQQGHRKHPWNVKDGWVTLEAVPWSESKVSKWHAASVAEVSKHHQPGKGQWPQHSLGNYWSDESIASEETPKYRPAGSPSGGSIGASSYYHGDAGDDDGYGSAPGGGRRPPYRLPAVPSPPAESLYNRRRPASSPLYSERPDPGERGGPTQPDDWYDQQQPAGPSLYDSPQAYHERGPTGAPPSNRDIITDGRPANFPKYAADQPVPGHGEPGPPPNQRGRPGSYPDRGNGEWVLISTTKGYQYPKRRHGQRAITFTPATSTSHQTVKLTVLPMKNAVDMTTSHNGLIEVSSSTQTVEDAVKQQKHKIKRHQPAAAPAHKKKKKHSAAGAASSAGVTGTFSLMRRDAAQDSSAVLAAVSAGMVPATMAILAPMVLGR